MTSAIHHLDRARADLAALPPQHVRMPNVDVGRFAQSLLSAVGACRSLKAELAALPGFDIVVLEKLIDYVALLRAAHRRCSTPAPDLRSEGEERQELLRRAVEVRRVLRDQVLSLAQYELVSADVLDQLSGVVGFQQASADLELLIATLNDAWPKIVGKCPLSRAGMRDLKRLAQRLKRARPIRRARRIEPEAADTRARAFTCCLNAYAELRRGVAFLRPRELEALLPAIYEGRPAHRRRAARDTPRA